MELQYLKFVIPILRRFAHIMDIRDWRKAKPQLIEICEPALRVDGCPVLCNDILRMIMEQLNYKDIEALSKTCRAFYAFYAENFRSFAKPIDIRESDKLGWHFAAAWVSVKTLLKSTDPSFDGVASMTQMIDFFVKGEDFIVRHIDEFGLHYRLSCASGVRGIEHLHLKVYGVRNLVEVYDMSELKSGTLGYSCLKGRFTIKYNRNSFSVYEEDRVYVIKDKIKYVIEEGKLVPC